MYGVWSSVMKQLSLAPKTIDIKLLKELAIVLEGGLRSQHDIISKTAMSLWKSVFNRRRRALQPDSLKQALALTQSRLKVDLVMS
jgi:hypothetical protein